MPALGAPGGAVAFAFASCQHWAGGYDPAVSMLGTQQEKWLYDGFAASRARWNILGINVMPGQPMIKFNPHIRFFDGDRRGYVRCRVERASMRVDLRMVSTVSRPDAPEAAFASFAVESGRPGALPG